MIVKKYKIWEEMKIVQYRSIFCVLLHGVPCLRLKTDCEKKGRNAEICTKHPPCCRHVIAFRSSTFHICMHTGPGLNLKELFKLCTH